MKLTYNRLGQITSEKWYDSADTLTAHYKFLYDDEGNVLRSVDILLSKEYNYSYEDDRIVRSTENDVTLDSNGMVTGRTVRRWVRYYYDFEGSLTKKVVKLLNGDEQVSYYENPEDISRSKIKRAFRYQSGRSLDLAVVFLRAGVLPGQFI